MSALGAVRVPCDNLEFLERRQISFKVRERLTRVLRSLSKAGAGEVHIPCVVHEPQFSQILQHLEYSAAQLTRTLGRRCENLPLLSGVVLTCLYGDYAVAAAKAQQETDLVVHLFSAERKSLHPDRVD